MNLSKEKSQGNQERQGDVEENKIPMTDEERLKLCQKMDEELDEFINSLEKKRYTDGWSEDTWQEEMEKHPFFMKSTPEGENLSPLAEGLAKLKYDPSENSPVELANNYKEDGNFNFKHKNYRMAILGYTEGIRVRCNDDKINAALYNNRAAAHTHLKNYRSALLDAEKALEFDPDYTKCRYRAAQCAFNLQQFQKCIDHCTRILVQEKDNKSELIENVMKLEKEARKKKMIKDRDDRRNHKKELERNEKLQAVMKAIMDRKIKLDNYPCDYTDFSVEHIIPNIPGGEECTVSLDDDGALLWPVQLQYPEYGYMDLIKEFSENSTLLEQLEQVFGEAAHWDEDKKYNINTVNVYYEGVDKQLHLVDINKTLGEIMHMKCYVLSSGMPVFLIFHKGCTAEKHCLERIS